MTTLERIAKGSKKLGAYAPKLVLNDGTRLTADVQTALSGCTIKENRIYTGNYTGSGRWTRSVDNSHYVIAILKSLGYKYTTGNDAVRGGITGEYVLVSKTAIKAITQLTK